MSVDFNKEGNWPKTEEIIQMDKDHALQAYGRKPIALVQGRGPRVMDADGKIYLDFLGGIAVNALGHCHPHVVEAICKQAHQLLHVSNIYYTAQQSKLETMLAERSGLDRAFFTNSGSEANETAIKLVRKWGKKKLGPQATQIVTAVMSFHGRTLATLAATGQPRFQVGFEPNVEGFTHIPFNDLGALEKEIGPTTCGVMLEPIQCESGIHPATPEYLKGVREICDRKGIALILDEVQTGMGRTGKLFAHQHYGIKPDVMTLAKALGGGVPISACLATNEVGSAFQPGDHGNTFGGGPLACSAAIATLETFDAEHVLDNCTAMGEYLKSKFKQLQSEQPLLKEVRGLGLIIGLELSKPCAKQVDNLALENGLLINAIGDYVLRLAPPLIINQKDADEAVSILEKVFKEF